MQPYSTSSDCDARLAYTDKVTQNANVGVCVVSAKHFACGEYI